MIRKWIILMFLLVLCTPSTVFAVSNNDIKASFIRNDNLWIKIGEKEVRLTNGEYIRFPK